MNYWKIKITLLLSLAVILTITALFFINQKYPNNTTLSFVYQTHIQNKQPPATSAPKNVFAPDSTFTIPSSLLLKVPFTPQAPTANWDQLHNEACEEASIIMANEYFSSSTVSNLDPEIVEAEITKLTKWQKENFGYHLSITSSETARMAQEVYGLKTEILTDISENILKKTLAEGKLIIFPANGRNLNNPNYKSPGPIYHMLIIKGYDSKGDFIANDPGTRKGLNYPYTFDVLYQANGDYSHDLKKVDLNKKTAIAIWR